MSMMKLLWNQAVLLFGAAEPLTMSMTVRDGGGRGL